MNQTPYYIIKMKERLSQRQNSNETYSMRAFARDLNLHSATLSQILQGKRNLPAKRACEVATKLQLSPKEELLFMESFYQAKMSIDKIKIGLLDQRQLLDESYYTIISEWEHYTVLELFNLRDFQFNPMNIAKKLSITKNRAEIVLQNLLDSKLILKNQDGSYESTYAEIKTTEDISSRAIKKSHENTLNRGLQKLEQIDIDLRDFSSITVAVDLKKMQEAKKIIREFRQKMNALFKKTDRTEVYQMAVQFYPLSNVQGGNKK